MAAQIVPWWEWTNVWTGVAQTVIALFGFGIAIYELRRTRGAAEATRALVLIESMRRAERDLDESLPKNRRQAVQALNDWRSFASEAHGVLSRMKAPNNLLATLEESRQIAAEAKGFLLGDARTSVANATHKARVRIAQVCDDVSQFVGDLR